MSRRRHDQDYGEACCPHCGGRLPAGLPSPALLNQLPGEGAGEYATRMRREWRRETTPRRRAHRLLDETQLEQDVQDVLTNR